MTLGALVLLGLASAAPASAATFVVTNTNSSGPGSLSAAILAANATVDLDTIKFAIPGNGGHTISQSRALPVITTPVVVNADSQPGFAGVPLIELHNGTGGTSTVGLDIRAGSSRVLGLSVTGFSTGIRLRDGDGNTIAGCWVGLDLGGNAGANATGIAITGASASNVVGGTAAKARNVISSNGVGVRIEGAGATGNVVEDDYVGTSADGTESRPNGDGILVVGGAAANTIGGTTAGARNLISGNTEAGVALRGSGTSGNIVEGNDVGTDPSGSAAVGNGVGLLVSTAATGNTIGGTTAGARNVVSGNLEEGVQLSGTGTTSNVVEGNYVGTSADGTAAVANANGVEITAGAKGNLIGGTSAGARNVVSGNLDGVALVGSGTTSNVVEGNYIGTSASGGAAVGNTERGVEIVDAAKGNTIGGTAAGARNVISGNGDVGVDVIGAGTAGNVVAGNYIGPAATGSLRLGVQTGIRIEGGATANAVGGTAAGAANLVSGNARYGVDIVDAGTSENVVAGNLIGTTPAGTNALKNAVAVQIGNGATGNTIGGTAVGSRNVISGNGGGVDITGAGTMTNLVAGNYIGTDVTGEAPLGNGYGVSINIGASRNTVGGTGPAARNVISGQGAGEGVIVVQAGSGNVVSGNYIGLDATGSGVLRNAIGVQVATDSGTTIGGAAQGAGNVVSGNGGDGIQITGATATTVAGNLVGTDASGQRLLGNGGDGILVLTRSSGNTIGGTSAAAANTIAGNGGSAVHVDDVNGLGETNGNSILRNSIFSNYGGGFFRPAIFLENTGNNEQQSPAIGSVTTNATATKIHGILGGFSPATDFRIEFFVSPTCGPTTHGEGKTFLGAKTVTTDGGGSATASLSVAPLARDQDVTATATSLGTHSTSGFSLCAATP